MVAVLRDNNPDAATDVALNLLWPGLSQLCQGRQGPAGYFALEALVLAVVFAAYPAGRSVTLAAIATLTVWSIVDVLVAARRRSSRS